MNDMTYALKHFPERAQRPMTFRSTPTADETGGDDPAVLHAGIALGERIRATGDEIERGRRFAGVLSIEKVREDCLASGRVRQYRRLAVEAFERAQGCENEALYDAFMAAAIRWHSRAVELENSD